MILRLLILRLYLMEKNENDFFMGFEVQRYEKLRPTQLLTPQMQAGLKSNGTKSYFNHIKTVKDLASRPIIISSFAFPHISGVID